MKSLIALAQFPYYPLLLSLHLNKILLLFDVVVHLRPSKETEHDANEMNHPLFFCQSYYKKSLFCKKGYFLLFLLSGDDADKMDAAPLLSQNLLRQNVFSKNGYFYSFYSLYAKPLILGQV